MIQIEDIKEIPDHEWNDLSGKEFAGMNPVARSIFVRFSSPIKAILRDGEIICVGGIFRQSLTDPGFLWALLSRGFDRAAARAIRSIEIPPCMTYVEAGNKRAERLAKYFKFELIEGNILMGETMYNLYRRS